MFLIDDYVDNSEAPWSKIRKSVANLAAIATIWDQDGVDLAFINSRQFFSCLGTTADVLSALDCVGSSDELQCTLKRKLDEMLSDYVNRYKDDHFTKPLNLIVITSGDFLQHDEFEETVMQWAKELDTMYAPKSQLGLQFVLVGCKEVNIRRFWNLDERMWKLYGVRDMVDATCYDPDKPEDPKILEKIMCGGMIKTFDRLDEHEMEDWEMLGLAY
ncbi:hypothetical protein BDD12DRAFT_743447 [Trichophaea hybrida]|nr:hypothetical protein BDD12DRAFT_743447 [Trichophaea hybrida]